MRLEQFGFGFEEQCLDRLLFSLGWNNSIVTVITPKTGLGFSQIGLSGEVGPCYRGLRGQEESVRWTVTAKFLSIAERPPLEVQAQILPLVCDGASCRSALSRTAEMVNE